MKRKSLSNILIYAFIAALLTLFTMTGCILDPAVQHFTTHSIEINVDDIIFDDDDKEAIPAAKITNVSLYAFDSQGNFVDVRNTGDKKDVSLETPSGEDYMVVLWADATNPDRTFPAPTPGKDRIEDCMITLSATRATTIYDSPGDLFHGILKVSNDGTSSNKITMKRMVGRMSITVKRLREFAQTTDSNFHLVVYATQSRMNFLGNLAGEFDAAYRPSDSFNAAGLYTTGAFNLFPSSSGLTIDVYHGDKLLRSVNSVSGNPITVTAGKTTNVLLDFSVLLDVRVSVTPWNVLEGWKEF